MAFFRDDGAEYKRFPPPTDYEKIETARWYIWSGWSVSAKQLLDEIAQDIPDVSYEESRFEEND